MSDNRPKFPQSAIRAAIRHAATEVPRECCGLLIAGVCHPSRNVIDQVPSGWLGGSADRPQIGTTDRSSAAATGYLLPPEDAVKLAEAWSAGITDLAIYHSHPNAPAVWSSADESLSRFAGRPLYPNVPRLIIGCRFGVPFEVCQYEFDGTAFRLFARFDIAGKTRTLMD